MNHSYVSSWIALGSNLGSPQQQLEQALAAMASLPTSKLAAVSSFYRSNPIGPQGQSDYLNAVARLDTALEPRQLLQQLQAIEKAQGRNRTGVRWEARTLDLDILLYGQYQCATPELVIPHPAMAARAFVLYPLHELEPELEIPGYGGIRELLPTVADQKVQALPVCHAAKLA